MRAEIKRISGHRALAGLFVVNDDECIRIHLGVGEFSTTLNQRQQYYLRTGNKGLTMARGNLALLLFLVSLFSGCGGSGSSADTSTLPVQQEPPAAVPPTPASAPAVLENIAPVTPPVMTSPSEPAQRINVTLDLSVPTNTPSGDSIYVSGDFEGWSGGGDPLYQFTPEDEGTYTLTFTADALSTIQFKVTRGSWAVEEVTGLGRQQANRVHALGQSDIRISLNVANWRDLTATLSNPDSGYWNTPTPDFSDNGERPVITLTGAPTLYLAVGEAFDDPGAAANDAQSGNLTSSIVVSHAIDTQQSGDYVVRYDVVDPDGNTAIGVSRIVRVGPAPAFSVRPVGSTHSHLGYMEVLPAEYGMHPDARFPLLIYHHGGGGDASSLDDTRDNALLAVNSLGGGPVAIAMQGSWDHTSPMIALTPQRSVLLRPSVERMDAFVEFALRNYQVDPDRVYMMGHSQGGLVSWQYAVAHPQKVSAIVPLAGGFFSGGIPDNVCDARGVAVWAFHSEDDNVISVNTGRAAVNALNNCGPAQPARFSVFSGLGHQSHQPVMTLQVFNAALASDDPFDQNLYEWLLEQPH